MRICSIIKTIAAFGKGVFSMIRYAFGYGRRDHPLDEEVEMMREFIEQQQDSSQAYLLNTLVLVDGHVELYIMPDQVVFDLVGTAKSVTFTYDEVDDLMTGMEPEEAANFIGSQLHDKMN